MIGTTGDDDFDLLRVLARDAPDEVHVLVDRYGALAAGPANELDGAVRILRELELERKEVALLLFGIAAMETCVTGHIMERACNLGIADDNVALQRADGLAENISLAAFRLNGEA